MQSSHAVEEVWRHTLSQIRPALGRLEYLASLRNPHSGRYEHFGLEQRFGPEESDRALRQSHESVFSAWIALPLERQKEEFHFYLSLRDEPARDLLANWLRLRPFPAWVPASTRNSERQLFLNDLDMVVELVRRESGVAAPDPDA